MPSTISAGTTAGSSIVVAGDTTGNLAFQTNGTTTAMTIDTSQRVGIGTSSPTYPLTVGNNRQIGGLNTAGAGVTFAIVNGSNNLVFGDDSTNTGTLTVQSRGNMLFNVNTAERMRIDSSGNISLGTASSSGNTSIFQAPGSLYLTLNTNGTLGGNRRNWAISPEYDAAGALSFTVGTSEGAAPTATRMLITSGGNVGIGTTSPSSSYRLQVQGMINFATVSSGITGQGAGFQDGGALFLGSDFQDPNGMSGTTNANFKFSTNRTGCVAASNPGSYVYEGFTSASGSRSFAVLSNGNVQNTNNSYGSLSDATIKQDIVDAASQWDDVKNLRVRKYRFIEEVGQNPDAKPQIGLIAQETELVSAGLVDKQIIYKQKLDADGNPIPDSYGVPEMEVDKELKTIKYSVLYMKAFKALQEAMERIEKLEAEVVALKGAK